MIGRTHRDCVTYPIDGGPMALDFTRRQLLLGAGAVSGIAVVGASCTDESTVGLGRPVARPTGWPDADAWQDLNQRVSGRLIQPVSPLRSCSLDASSAECETALEAMKNPFFHEDQVGSTQSTGWMDAWQSAVSPYAVEAETAQDIAAAVDFAREHEIRLAVKGAGHDYLGRNNAPDSLLVWTHRMRNINMHDAFVPAGAPNGTDGVTALSVGAGTRWIEAYAAATNAGRYVQGGGCTSVGASGGFIQGSGFGSFSKAFGTGSGGVLEFEVITADGEVRVVNQHQDPDLFWALRGGGGSTFGIVARTTLLAHPIPNNTGTVSGTIVAKDDAAYEDLVGAAVAFYPVALDNPSWGEQIRFRPDNTVEFALTFLDLSRAEAEATFAPLLEPLRAQSDRFEVDVSFVEIPFERLWDVTWWQETDPDFVTLDPRPNQPDNQYWWSGNQGEVAAYWFAYESRWVPTSMLVDRPADATRMLVDASKLRNLTFQINKGLSGQSAESRERDRDTALHPTAFDAAALIIMASAEQYAYPGITGHEPDRAKGRRERDEVAAAMSIVRGALPGQGAYANEASYFTEDWKNEFWGPNYERLLEIKRRVDPTNLFRVHHGVGSDE